MAADKILSGFTPATTLDLTSTVSGLSVLSRTVTHAVPIIHASSCIPPEPVLHKIIDSEKPNSLVVLLYELMSFFANEKKNLAKEGYIALLSVLLNYGVSTYALYGRGM